MKKIYLIYIFILLTACFPEDEMVPPHQPGDLQVGLVEIGPDYHLQSFYDLNGNREISVSANTEWDLGFESAGDGYRIILNSSKFMYAGNSGETIFEDVASKDVITMYFDQSDGNPDSAAVRNWIYVGEDTVYSKKEVFVIDRGVDEDFNFIGFKKIVFDIFEDAYVIRFADLDNQNEETLSIARDAAKNFICFSFENGIVDIEPDRDLWSFKISRYTSMLVTDEGNDYPYIVFGVLLNQNRVVAALDTIHDFADITISDTLEVTFTNKWDVIGYEWKYFNFDAEIYTIVPENSYIIRDRDGYYYKLRFVDFYSDQGEKGHPKFEYLAL